jgi:hypothetical protein
MADHMLTTTDNPFNPFTQYDEWWAFDADQGYHTPAYLARICHSSDELSEEDQSLAIEEAIDECIYENPLGIYRRIAAPTAE